MRISQVTQLCLMGLLLVGCANQNSIFRNHGVANNTVPSIVTTDAKQRHVIAVPQLAYTADGKTVYSNGWRICAEASPDVFSALSTSASGELGIGNGTSEQRVQGAIAIAEAAGTIERTQTINLFRESMYRTCERYLNNAIGGSELTVQAARDQRMMVAILAIEQLTRSVWPKTTIINAGQASASLSNSNVYLDVLAEAAKTKAKAEKAVQQAAAAKENIEKECEAVPAVTDGEASEITLRRASCDAGKSKAKSDLDAANDRLSEAEAILKELRNVPQGKVTSSFSATAGAGGSPNTVEVNEKPHLGDVSKAVTDIVTASLAFDEIEMLCVRTLLQPEKVARLAADSSSLEANCVSLVAAKARIQADDERKIIEERQDAKNRIETKRNLDVAKFNEAIEAADQANLQEWWANLVEGLPVVNPAELKSLSSKAEITDRFSSLLSDHRDLVLKKLGK